MNNLGLVQEIAEGLVTDLESRVFDVFGVLKRKYQLENATK